VNVKNGRYAKRNIQVSTYLAREQWTEKSTRKLSETHVVSNLFGILQRVSCEKAKHQPFF